MEIITSTQRLILADILAERARQDERWGGAGHDDAQTVLDWARYLDERVGRLGHRDDGRMVGEDRRLLLHIAALAVAALESYDRRAGEPEEESPCDK